MRNQPIFKGVFLLGSLLVLTSCGKDGVCVLGMGNCQNYASPTTTKENQSATSLKLDYETPNIKINEKMTFTATGGVPPHRITQYSGHGTIITSTTKVVDGVTSVVYQAANVSDSAIIQVYDSKNNRYKVLIEVTE